MQNLEKIGDELSPKIILNHSNNVFLIEGESRPEHPIKYFEPVFSWFNEYFEYLKNSNTLTKEHKHLTIKLDYFNSTSAKILFDLFILLKNTGEKKYNVIFEIDWNYIEDDIDMLDSGKEMENLSGLKFNYISKK